MVNEQPNVNPTGRYSVTDTCRLLGIHRNTLLKHTKIGHIKVMKNKTTKKKIYVGQAIIEFWHNMM